MLNAPKKEHELGFSRGQQFATRATPKQLKAFRDFVETLGKRIWELDITESGETAKTVVRLIDNGANPDGLRIEQCWWDIANVDSETITRDFCVGFIHGVADYRPKTLLSRLTSNRTID